MATTTKPMAENAMFIMFIMCWRNFLGGFSHCSMLIKRWRNCEQAPTINCLLAKPQRTRFCWSLHQKVDDDQANDGTTAAKTDVCTKSGSHLKRVSGFTECGSSASRVQQASLLVWYLDDAKQTNLKLSPTSCQSSVKNSESKSTEQATWRSNV